MENNSAGNNVEPEISRRKRLINLASLLAIVPMIALLELMRRGVVFAPIVWAVAASALLLAHAIWVLSLMRCPNCAKFVKALLKQPACPHCGISFTQNG